MPPERHLWPMKARTAGVPGVGGISHLVYAKQPESGWEKLATVRAETQRCRDWSHKRSRAGFSFPHQETFIICAG